MGVQPRGKKKSEVEELREQVRGMRVEINELKRATQADTEDYCSDADSGADADVASSTAASRRKKAVARRQDRRRSPPSESDDDEETPE